MKARVDGYILLLKKKILRYAHPVLHIHVPQGPHSYILLTEWTVGLFGSELLAKTEVFGSVKDVGIFMGRQKITRDFLGVFYFSSAQVNNN